MSMHFRSLAQQAAFDGAISADEVLSLRHDGWENGVIDRDEADALFELNRQLGKGSEEWTNFFIEAISAFVFANTAVPGHIDEDAADWLIEQLGAGGRLETFAELELLEREFAAHWLKKTSNNTNIMLPAFALARYPTTVAQFVLFVEDHGYDPDAPWWDAAGVAWLRAGDPTLRVWRDRHAGRYPNYPVVDVSWYEAVAFCRWLSQHRKYNPAGYRFVLPNEAEWEFAARGPTRRAFPWGAEPPDATRANFGGLYQGTSAVGCFAEGATPEGIYDMAGNVWEWTRSILHDYPYELNAEREYPDKPAANLFIVRGGCWTNHATDLHMSFRHPYAPDMRYSGLGFRVARHLTFS